MEDWKGKIRWIIHKIQSFREKSKSLKIRTQLTLSLVLVMVGSALVSFLIAGYVTRSIVLNQIKQRQISQLQILASFSGQAVVLRNKQALESYLRFFIEIPGVSYAYFVNKDGKILLHTNSQYVNRSLKTWQASKEALETIELKRKIKLGNSESGTLRIGFAQTYVNRTLRQVWLDLFYPILWLTIWGIVIIFYFGAGLAVYMTRPIQYLVKGSQEISQGNLSVEVPVVSYNELGDLARQFNSMVRKLKEVDERKAEFISIVSHDLRSPLGAIIAYSDYLLSGEAGVLQPKQVKAIEIIRNQCRHLNNMVNNILDMAKIQSGRMEYVSQPFNLKGVAEEVHSLFDYNAFQKKISLGFAVSADLPLVVGDAEKIQQVIINLVSNALKFTKSGGYVLIGAKEMEGGVVQIFVKDTGPGIPPQELPRVFERFHQINLKEQKALKIRGTGLGLAICKGIVEGLGGKIWVESKQNYGTTFYFTLSAAKKSQEEITLPVMVGGERTHES
ncbi:MAG: HAMP domain-containing histidine kinase [Elusimicrobia bacterium]|nr:HAMP domain-containing histidine kinase [Elusimicrobiota bacterium]